VFIRSVRVLHDLRHYSTAVMVNNQGGSVNVAGEGGQQTNVVKRAKKKRIKLVVQSRLAVEDFKL
jgi:hypothetical protein